MLTHEENDLLCRVEGDAPMGQLMRRHWVPAALSEQVSEPDGAPVRLRLFGEDLVAFRDTDGRLGVLGEHCPHRKASLALGRNEECGLRCLYHGWKFDVEGNVLEMASEPAESGFAEKVKHKAYPTRGMRAASSGSIWAPASTMPEFEPPPWAPTPDTKVSIVKIDIPCNWAQIMEGQIDFGAFVEPALLRHAAGARRYGQGGRHALAASVDRQVAEAPGPAHQLRLPLRRHPPADQQRQHARLTCASPPMWRRSRR